MTRSSSGTGRSWPHGTRCTTATIVRQPSSGTYVASCTGNSVLKANIGRAARVCGITLGDTIANPGYPAASAKIQIDATFTDAPTKLFNPHSVAVTTTDALDSRVAAVEQIETDAAALRLEKVLTPAEPPRPSP